MTFAGHIVYLCPEQHHLNDATRDTNKLYVRQKSCDYHYYQYTRPNRTNSFHRERLFNMKSCCGLQIPFTARTLPFGPRFREGSLSLGHARVVIMSENRFRKSCIY